MTDRPNPASQLMKQLPPGTNWRALAATIGGIVFAVAFIAAAAWSDAFPPWMGIAGPFIVLFVIQAIRQELKERAAQAYWRSQAAKPDAGIDAAIQVCLWHPAEQLASSLKSHRSFILDCVNRLRSEAQVSEPVAEVVRSFESGTPAP